MLGWKQGNSLPWMVYLLTIQWIEGGFLQTGLKVNSVQETNENAKNLPVLFMGSGQNVSGCIYYLAKQKSSKKSSLFLTSFQRYVFLLHYQPEKEISYFSVNYLLCHVVKFAMSCSQIWGLRSNLTYVKKILNSVLTV